MPQKTNHRRIPKTQADVDRAQHEGYSIGAEFTCYILLFILSDMFGWKLEQLKALMDKFDFYIKQIAEGEVKYNDLRDAVKKEYNFNITIHNTKRKGNK